MFQAIKKGASNLFGYAFSGYDAVNPDTKRRNSGNWVRSSDEMLSDTGRRGMTEAGRDLFRNFPVAAWAIRKHVDYVSDFSFQCRVEPVHRKLNAMVVNAGQLRRWWATPVLTSDQDRRDATHNRR